MTDNISNTDDRIDSRDVIARIEELEESCKAWRAKMCDFAGIDREEDFADHGDALDALAEWIDDHGIDFPSVEDECDKAAKVIRTLAVGETYDGPIGETGINITIAKRDDLDSAEVEELASLKKLAQQGESYGGDWDHGATLIHDSHFTAYAEELAEEIGAIKSDAAWPARHIDWDAAAAELQQDYTSIDFDGETYWIS